MASEKDVMERTLEKEKQKAPSTASGDGAARSRAKRAPTVAEMCMEMMRRMEVFRREMLGKVKALEDGRQEILEKLKSLEDSMMDVVTNQLLQAEEIWAIREKLEAFESRPTESPIPPSGKRSAETPAEVQEQEKSEGAARQPVIWKRVKVAVSKRPVYRKDEYVRNSSEPPIHEERQQEIPAVPEVPVTPQSPPIPEMSVPTMPHQPPPRAPEAPIPEPVPMRVVPQQSASGKAPKCAKCNFFHKGVCTMQPNTCFRCMQSGHLARDCKSEMVCNICKMPGHLAKGCLRGRNGKKN